jgi:hypothetical protein
VAGFSGHGNEPSGCIQLRELLNQLSDYRFLRRPLLHEVSNTKQLKAATDTSLNTALVSVVMHAPVT